MLKGYAQPSSQGVSGELDLLAYRVAIAESVVALDIHTENRDSFRGNLGVGVSGDIHMLNVRADQHAVHRTPALVSRTAGQYFKFSIIEQGTGFITQDGHESVLRPGDMVIYDTGRPYSLHFEGKMQMIVFMFPHEMLDLPARYLRKLTAQRYSSAEGVGSVVYPYLSSLGHQNDDTNADTRRRLYRAAVEIIQTLLHSSIPAKPQVHDVLLGRISDYIDDHLPDQDLDPTRIAQDHFISVRHLHALFSEQDSTVSTMIRSRRLDRCYDELVNPLNADRPVSAIAHSNGFVDAAHFSRSFRARFGIPPSSLRSKRQIPTPANLKALDIAA